MLYNIPPRNPIFTGRDDILASLPLGFQRSPLLILHGPKGMGKTQIALEYCYRCSPMYKRIWLNASSRLLLYLDVGTLGALLSLPNEVRENEQLLFAAFKQWLQEQSDWLLVLDSLDDFTLLNLIIPPEPQGYLIATTRHDPFGSSSSSPVPPGLSEPILLLLRQAGFIAHPEIMVKTIGSSLTDAVALFQQRQAGFSKKGERAYDAFQQKEVRELFLAFSRILPPLLLDVLRLLAFFHPEPIPQEFLLNAASVETPEPLSSLLADSLALEQALSDLETEELLSRLEDDRSLLTLHPGLETVLVMSLTNEEQRTWGNLAVKVLNHVFPEVRFDTRAACQRYLPHAQRCASLIIKYQLTLKEGALLLERMGTYCFRQASYAEAETYFTQALELYKYHHHTDILDTAQTMNSLALLYTELARYQDAEALHLRALELRELELGSDHPKTAESLHNLAMLYGDRGLYKQAEEHYLRVLALEERSKGTDHLDVATTLNNLGLIYYYQGQDAQAEAAYRRVLTIYERSLPSGHPDWAYPLDGLGALAERQGNEELAEGFYQQALVICEHAFGKKHPETAHSINKLADIAASRGNDILAKELYEQALSIVEHALGSEHPDVALFLTNLAFLATKQRLYQQAEPLYQRALNIYERTFGPEHPMVALVLHNQGHLFQTTGDLDRAEELLRQALVIYERVLDSMHPDIAESLVDLATLLSDRDADEKAEPLLQRALALRLQALGPKHLEVVNVQERLVALQKRRNKNSEDVE